MLLSSIEPTRKFDRQHPRYLGILMLVAAGVLPPMALFFSMWVELQNYIIAGDTVLLVISISASAQLIYDGSRIWQLTAKEALAKDL